MTSIKLKKNLPPMPKSGDYYRVLGMPPGATYDELHAKYRELALQHHPDRGGGADEQFFRQLTYAWGVLKDADLRRLYDAQRAFEGRNCPKCLGTGLGWRSKSLCLLCQGSGEQASGGDFK